MKPHFFCHISLMVLSSAALAQTKSPQTHEALGADAAPPPGTASAARLAPAPSVMQEAATDVARMDDDRSGSLEPREAARLPRLRQRFEEFDIDHDGMLSVEEYAAWLSVPREPAGEAAAV